MAFMRDAAPVGQTVSLRAIIKDPTGEPVSPDGVTLTLYLYDEDNETTDLDTAIEDSDYTGATQTIAFASLTEISTGFYEYQWAIPAGTDVGTWYDLWVCEIQGVETADYFEIEVIETGDIDVQDISTNTLVIIVLSETIAADSGNTLEEETQLSFSTRYSPYYASTDLVRLECGSWIDGIPGDALALMIHWSSLSANAYCPDSPGGNSPRFETARTKFVIFDAALRALILPANVGGKKKTLGDLMIENSSQFGDIIEELKWERSQWARVMNAGGEIVPGQSLEPTFGVKGIKDPDRRKTGRSWAKTHEYSYPQPLANGKVRLSSRNRRYKRAYVYGG